MNNSWEVTIEEDEHGELILPFPPELIEKNGWIEGDELEFEIREGAIIITNLTEKIRSEVERSGL
jgi:bifunctional DNA-binding transcriptional regulator/antitoxin component of YhaV-PrlF toxin-antitoxin module